MLFGLHNSSITPITSSLPKKEKHKCMFNLKTYSKNNNRMIV